MIVGGILLTALSAVILRGYGAVAFYGLVLVGAIQLIVGVFQWLRYQLSSERRKNAHHEKRGLTTIIQAMLYTARVDGIVDDREVKTIQAAVRSLCGVDLPEEDIRRRALQCDNSAEFISHAAKIAGEISISDKEIVVKGMILVALADENIDSKEDRFIYDLSNAIGVSDAEVNVIARELHRPRDSAGSRAAEAASH